MITNLTKSIPIVDAVVIKNEEIEELGMALCTAFAKSNTILELEVYNVILTPELSFALEYIGFPVSRIETMYFCVSPNSQKIEEFLKKKQIFESTFNNQ